MAFILTIDPGPEQSAYLLYDPHAMAYPFVALEHEIVANMALRDKLRSSWLSQGATACVLEKIEHYGMPAGESLFTTCLWIGRFIEAWGQDASYVLMPRREVKRHLCQSARATDATIRAALMDLYSLPGQDAIGRKKTPGPLYGISKDVWSCLALAVTYVAHAKGPCLECGWDHKYGGLLEATVGTDLARIGG